MKSEAADVIIENDDKILLLKRNFDPEKGKFDLIGGHLYDGETPEQGAIREAKEEAGVEISLVRKIGEFKWFDKRERKNKVDHVFEAKIVKGDVKSSEEGLVSFVPLEKIKPEVLAFPEVHTKVLEKYKYLRKKQNR